ncbi:methyltransferase [Flavobacterium sp. AS60]|uniref:methyltransferase n=1 Tax=Flavobacterium anseongense TaxID=2910677 RepID=UPI001F40E14A|nr:methyltransferase [Flavobacterium sp. AS60]MCF6128468.1 methyltransferase [Flavobacterium sp. AS60]
MRAFLKKISHPFLKLGLRLYYWKPRTFCYDNISIKVHPEVFPPQMTFSTKILLDFINDLDLKQKTFLELGCGSGIISLLAAKKGADVTSSDINQIALDYLATNASKNKLQLKIVHSDLFDKLKNQSFDYIIINPPYYPKKPKNIKEQAWFCGENFEYFEKLFVQLPSYLATANCYMILSQDCDVEKIKAIGLKKALTFEVVLEKKELVETNYIFKVVSL